MRTRIKICGITQSDDLHYAARLGVDAVGLVFQPQSPRCLSVSQAQAVLKHKPPFLSIVALFADAEPKKVRNVMAAVKIDYLQFHGNEPAEYCRSFNTNYLKAIPMGSLENPGTYISEYLDSAVGVVLDSHCSGEYGGSGKTFDWSKVQATIRIPVILAGGLNPTNVESSIVQVKPYAVDVASGVESAKGVKDNTLMREFVMNVRQADQKRTWQ